MCSGSLSRADKLHAHIRTARLRNLRELLLPAKTIELTNVSYDPTRQLYLEINAAFAAQWKAKTGDVVKVRQSHGDILETGEGQAIVMETVDECQKVAAAAGHDPGEKGMKTIRSFLTVKGSKFTASMLHDLEKGSMVEADHIVGDMIARAKKAGISTPLLRVAYAHLQVYLHRRGAKG